MVTFQLALLTLSYLTEIVFTITDSRKYEEQSLYNFVPPSYLPNSRSCFCIPLIKCQPLYSLLSNHPVHPETIDFLRNQTCGFYGRAPYVCCYEQSYPYAPQPPKVPQPRTEKCTLPKVDPRNNEIEHTSEVPHLVPRFHPSFGPHFTLPSMKPANFNPFHPHKNFQNDIPMHHFGSSEEDDPPVTVENRSKEADLTKIRSRVLPDDTCGLSLDERIIGGKEVKIGTYPWVARIGYTRPRSHEYLYRCGGALINTRFVVSAAHCATNLPGGFKLATVRLGELDERTDPDCEGEECADQPEDFTPIMVIVHRNYDKPRYKNDIALLKLDREVEMTPYISPICLPYNLMKTANYSGVQATTAGWGVISITSRASSPILKHVDLNITSIETCRGIYSSRFQLDIGEEQFCTTGIKGQDACEGDSGGPLMKYQQYEGVPRYFLLGIVSFGPTQCGTSGLPSVFTRVTYYLDWIVKHIDSDNEA